MKMIWVCPMVLVLGACSSSNQPSATNGQSASTSSAVPTQTPPSRSEDAAWQLGYKNDPMDGNLVRAARTYSFPDIDTSVQVDFVCTIDKKRLQINLTSVVGSPEKPSNASTFQQDRLGNLDGRIKFSNLSPDWLPEYFRRGENFGNIITYTLSAGDSFPKMPFIYKAHGIYVGSFDSIDPLISSYMNIIGISPQSIQPTLGIV